MARDLATIEEIEAVKFKVKHSGIQVEQA